MAGFRKAKAEQAYLKMAMYGPPGSGKTFTALLVAEGLAAASGRRVAVVDTERGTDFYCQAVEARPLHPEAFDFDAVYTRSLTEVLCEVRQLDQATHGVVVLDSVTHLWEAAIAAYTGRKTGTGSIPMHAWGGIKKPYKDLMQLLLNAPLHVLILGRQGNEFAEDEVTGQTQAVGVKMKAEGETPYEPHVLVRMECVKQTRKAKVQGIVTAFAEKDRTGILQGRLIEWPTFETLAAPILPYLAGGRQAQLQSGEDAAAQDASAIAQQDRERAAASRILREQFEARLKLARGVKEVVAVGNEITPAVKRQMTAADVTALREAFLAAKAVAEGLALAGAGDDQAERKAIEEQQ